MKKIGLFLLMIGAFLGASLAYSQDCDPTIVDGASILGGDTAQIQAAADKLQSLGVTVKVRTVQSFGSAGNLDRYERSVLKSCSSWQSADGGRLSHLIVVMVEMEHRELGLYYGDQWRPALDGQWNDIKDTVMAPRLRDGNFAGAFTETLDVIRLRIEQSKQQARMPIVPIAVGPTTVINKEPTDFSGLGLVMWWALVIISVALAIGAIGALLLRWVDNKRQRTARQHQAQIAKSSCASLSVKCEERLRMLAPRLAALGKKASENDIEPLRQQEQSLQQSNSRLLSDYTQLTDVAAMNPDSEGLTLEQYSTIAEKYSQLEKAFGALDADIQSAETAIIELSKLADSLPATLATIELTVQTTREKISSISATGFKTTAADKILKQGERLLDQAQKALGNRALITTRDKAATAMEKMTEALAAAESLAAQRATCQEGITSVTAAHRTCEKLLGKAKTDFDQMKAAYAESSWQSVSGNGSQAEKLLATAEEQITAATSAADMQAQDWSTATSSCEHAVAAIEEATRLLEDLRQRYKDVQQAEKKSGAEIEAAAKDIDKATNFIEKHDADIDVPTLRRDLDQAMKLLGQARKEHTRKQPNFIEVVRLALQANAAADNIFAAAQDQHEAMERKRARLISLTEEARRSIDAADRYIRSHRGDVGSTGQSDLAAAQNRFSDSEKAAELDRQLALMEEADNLADNALSQAQHKVRAAKEKREEEEREEARRRRASMSSSSSSSGGFGSSGSSGSFGGGGSSGFGGVSFGGGGSSSFSAPSFGGGGSGKW